jgi:hypothetical protein
LYASWNGILAALWTRAQRACGNGEVVDIGRDVPAAKEAAPSGVMPPASVQGRTTAGGTAKR